MSLTTFLQIVLRSWKLILVAVVITTVAAMIVASQATRTYEASTTVELRASETLTDERTIISVFNTLDNRTLITTIARKASSNSTQEAIAQKLNTPIANVRAADLDAVVVPQANLIEIRATATDPNLAANICNAAAAVLVEQSFQNVLEIEVLDPAVAPSNPVQGSPLSILPLALVSGLIIGIVFALIEHALRQVRLGRGQAELSR